MRGGKYFISVSTFVSLFISGKNSSIDFNVAFDQYVRASLEAIIPV